MAITLLMTLVAIITREGRESVAEVQVDEGIIPVIADLDVPLVMGSRPKKLIKATQETAMVSWDRKRKGSVEDEDVPLPSERVKSLEALLLCRYNLRIPAGEDAGETAVNRSKRQLNKHCIKLEGILRTETRNGETAGTRVKRTKPGNKTELEKREEPEQSSSRPSQQRPIWMHFGHTSAAWLEHASGNCKTSPAQPRPRACSRTTTNRFPWLWR